MRAYLLLLVSVTYYHVQYVFPAITVTYTYMTTDHWQDLYLYRVSHYTLDTFLVISAQC